MSGTDPLIPPPGTQSPLPSDILSSGAARLPASGRLDTNTPSGLPVSSPEPEKRQQTLVETLIDCLKRGDVAQFNKLRPPRTVDLSGIDLKGLDLRKVNLSRCKLTRANLAGCRLEGADLSQSDLSRADLSGSWLGETSFIHSKLDYALLTKVRNASLADFQSASLVRADLSCGNFSGAKFNYSKLDAATLSGGDFSSAQFVDCRMPGALLNGTSFKQAHMERARLFQASGVDVDFSEANLCDAEAVRAHFKCSPVKGSEEEKPAPFKGAWVHGLIHDGFGSTDSLLSGAIDAQRPPQGMFPQTIKPELKKREIDGMPGTDLERWEDALAELDKLIGLKSVKQHVKEQFAMMRFQYARSQQGLAEADLNLHFVFTGPPGTGKTTVARIISKLLHAIGYLKKGHLVEVQKANLIGGYQGQTPMKTEEKIRESLDGTMFIDEAYSLTQSEHDDYSKDCIATLLKMMEDNRGRLTVIAAGYSKEMESFIKSNSGLESRFTIKMDFPSYSNGELVEIMKGMLKSKQFEVDPSFLARASIMLAVMRAKKGEKEFGNARVVRNLVQAAVLRMAKRVEGTLAEPGALTKMKAEDLPFEDIMGCTPDKLNIAEFRWKPADGVDLSHDGLALEGVFPELTQDSLEMAQAIVKIEKLKEAEEDLDEMESKVEKHSTLTSEPKQPAVH